MIKIEKPKKAYKLVRKKKLDKHITSLFINKNVPLPKEQWIKAEDHKTEGFKHRPGWHTMRMPLAPHLTKKGREWWEVEICNWSAFDRPEAQGGIWYLSEWIRFIKPYGKAKKKKKKYSKLVIDLGYVVDPEDSDMVQEAYACFYEDIRSAYKYGDIYDHIKIVDSPSSTRKDIPQFLLEKDDDF